MRPSQLPLVQPNLPLLCPRPKVPLDYCLMCSLPKFESAVDFAFPPVPLPLLLVPLLVLLVPVQVPSSSSRNQDAQRAIWRRYQVRNLLVQSYNTRGLVLAVVG